ncbi:efflux RND transporter periplasmic adaptor subunit [Acidithiobacillus sp.]|jgi:HlyD family secretion protein|uniref:efflux RND transporter periplasmic adaptor subunit n=1 Tax=Acidithiobacillus sp. TaxID=1872118 RepID=UPI0025C16D75|nr:efflux RND transporter periplasmic adaptor subunit [Acidithiobacillus sp.]MCK9189792.1 efflux RND transporter periplasmic adaptor subunit [Acidithiobacillus sp.]MCK9358223.1 efflux RND transporter periplasmic adaptor subunit [Acidithiobacillus sp.]
MATAKKRMVIAAAVILAIGAGVAYWETRPMAPADRVTIYGNVDIRQVQAAFDDSGRILRLAVQEGDRVHKGQLLAELDPIRFLDAVDRDQASVATQEQVLARLLAGSRPEEIAAARASAAAAQATLANAEITWRRQQALAAEQYVPKQNLDNAAAALKTARANLDHAQQGLTLAIKGPRKEDIAAARSQLTAEQAALHLAQRQLVDTQLFAPQEGVVQDRILEPGDMASPQVPVFTLALDNPVWVRAYLPEKSLGQVRLGMQADIESDSFPDKHFAGWVGFISPTAEFTPKTVQTTDLRTELVYRVRIYACNPGHQLRLGMPVTVQIPLRNNPPQNRDTNVCGR